MTTKPNLDETRIAQQIVSVLPDGAVARLCSDDRDKICYAVADASLKLKTIVFSRESLRRLAIDPAFEIKLDYLRRDLVRSAARRAEFRYPRENRIVTAIRSRRAVRIAKLAMAR